MIFQIVIATRKKSLLLNSDRWRHVESNVWLVATMRNVNNLISLLKKIMFSNHTLNEEFYNFSSEETRIQTAKSLFKSPIKLDINIFRPGLYCWKATNKSGPSYKKWQIFV